jgi:hypothetical protein
MLGSQHAGSGQPGLLIRHVGENATTLDLQMLRHRAKAFHLFVAGRLNVEGLV